MAILVLDDFSNSEIKKAVELNTDYIADGIVIFYWRELASKYDVPNENLPAEPSEIVKLYLTNEVSIRVASDRIGSNLEEIIEGVTTDVWEQKKNAFISDRDRYLGMISASDIYDPENPPETPGDSSTTRINFG